MDYSGKYDIGPYNLGRANQVNIIDSSSAPGSETENKYNFVDEASLVTKLYRSSDGGEESLTTHSRNGGGETSPLATSSFSEAASGDTCKVTMHHYDSQELELLDEKKEAKIHDELDESLNKTAGEDAKPAPVLQTLLRDIQGASDEDDTGLPLQNVSGDVWDERKNEWENKTSGILQQYKEKRAVYDYTQIDSLNPSQNVAIVQQCKATNEPTKLARMLRERFSETSCPGDRELTKHSRSHTAISCGGLANMFTADHIHHDTPRFDKKKKHRSSSERSKHRNSLLPPPGIVCSDSSSLSSSQGSEDDSTLGYSGDGQMRAAAKGFSEEALASKDDAYRKNFGRSGAYSVGMNRKSLGGHKRSETVNEISSKERKKHHHHTGKSISCNLAAFISDLDRQSLEDRQQYLSHKRHQSMAVEEVPGKGTSPPRSGESSTPEAEKALLNKQPGVVAKNVEAKEGLDEDFEVMKKSGVQQSPAGAARLHAPYQSTGHGEVGRKKMQREGIATQSRYRPPVNTHSFVQRGGPLPAVPDLEKLVLAQGDYSSNGSHHSSLSSLTAPVEDPGVLKKGILASLKKSGEKKPLLSQNKVTGKKSATILPQAPEEKKGWKEACCNGKCSIS